MEDIIKPLKMRYEVKQRFFSKFFEIIELCQKAKLSASRTVKVLEINLTKHYILSKKDFGLVEDNIKNYLLHIGF